MGFTIQYQRVFKLRLWQYRWLLQGADNLVLDPDLLGNSDAVRDRIMQYDLRRILRVEPTLSTQELLKKRSLICKTTTTGITVVSKASYTEPDTDFRLSFAIRVIDPEWQDYTETGVASIQGQIFHLTNFGLGPASPTLLTDGGNNVLRADHFVPRQGRIVRLPATVAGQASTMEVFDALHSSPDSVLDFSFPALAGQEEYELDCRSLRAGLYRITGTNIATTTLYLGLEDLPDLIGVIDLLISGWEGSTFDARLAQP